MDVYVITAMSILVHIFWWGQDKHPQFINKVKGNWAADPHTNPAHPVMGTGAKEWKNVKLVLRDRIKLEMPAELTDVFKGGAGTQIRD